MSNSHRLLLGLAAGCLTAFTIAVLGFSALRTFWPAYAAAEPEKAYNLAMLLSRLSLGALGTVAAAGVATLIAGESTRTAWSLGILFFLISLPWHVHVWSDYPAWYHFVFLGYLIPLAGLTGWIVRACSPITASSIKESP